MLWDVCACAKFIRLHVIQGHMNIVPVDMIWCRRPLYLSVALTEHVVGF